jgi:hypothetical protein
LAEQYEVSQIGTKINAVNKEIGKFRKDKKEVPAELPKQKEELEKERKRQEDVAAAKNNGTLIDIPGRWRALTADLFSSWQNCSQRYG